MPDLQGDVSAILSLHRRCRSAKALPFQGGTLEQPEWVLAAFDAIDGAIAAHRAKTSEDLEMDLKKKQLEVENHGGRR